MGINFVFLVKALTNSLASLLEKTPLTEITLISLILPSVEIEYLYVNELSPLGVSGGISKPLLAKEAVQKRRLQIERLFWSESSSLLKLQD